MDSPTPSSGNVPGGVEAAPGLVLPEAALRFSHARSSGPGGQNVNKVNTKAELRVSLDALAEAGLPARAMVRLARQAKAHLTQAGDVLITSDEHRSQKRNRDACLEKLREMLVKAMVEPKPRKKTKPSRGAVERRLQAKKRRGEIKAARGKVEP